MNVNDMMTGKYLKAETMTKPALLTIDKIVLEKMNDGKDKWAMYFREITEGFVLNKTNLNTLAELFGPETDDWERQKIVLFVTKVEYGGKMVPGIRVRLPKQAPPAPEPQRPAPARRPAPVMTQAEADMDDDDLQAAADDDIPF